MRKLALLVGLLAVIAFGAGCVHGHHRPHHRHHH